MAKSPAIKMAARLEPLAGEKLANKTVTIEAAPAASRISLRGNAKGFEKALGFALPKKPKTSVSKRPPSPSRKRRNPSGVETWSGP